MTHFLNICMWTHDARILLLLLLLLRLISCASATANDDDVQRSAHDKVPPRPTRVARVRQTLDHFAFDDTRTFDQKVLVYEAFANTSERPPLLVYFGNEGAVEDFYNNTGAMFEIGENVSAVLLFLEHRYYGSSLPFGPESYATENLKYLTIESALADMALFLVNVTEFLGYPAGPVVLFGGSYGGMLSAWFLIKYPHLARGALAASAPVDLFPGENKSEAFFDAGMYVYGKYGSPKCEATLRTSLRLLSRTDPRDVPFRTCSPLSGAEIETERLSMYVNGALSTMAMVDYPFPANFVTPMPANPVRVACDRLSSRGTATTADRLLGLRDAIDVFVNYTGQLECHNISNELLSSTTSLLPKRERKKTLFSSGNLGDITRPWNYQCCTELILEPLTSDGNGFFVESPSLVKDVETACRERFGGSDLSIRKNWIQDSFGNGTQIVRSLRNVIFSDGEKDPWRVGGVPNDAQEIGDGSVVHIFIQAGAHHQDLRYDSAEDSEGVRKAKRFERETIRKWILSD